MADREPSAPFSLRSMALTIYVPTLLMGIGQSAVLAFVVLQARDLGASLGLAGVVFAMRGLGVMAFDVPAGLVLARIGPRRSMLASVALVGVFATLAAFSPNPLVLGALVFALGGSTALWMLARIALVSDSAPVEQRGRAISLLGGSQRIGNFAGPAIGGFVAQALGFEGAMLLQTVGAVAALALVFRFVHDRPGMMVATTHAPAGLMRTLKDSRQSFLTAGLAMVALQVLRQGRQVLLPLWGDELGLGPAEIGLVVAFASFIDMLLFYPVGIVMDRFGRKWSAVPSMLLLGGSLLLVPLTGSFEALLVVGLVSGFANGLGSGIGMTLGADLAPPGRQGEFLGVWRFVGDIGTSGGPLVVAGVTGVATLGLACVAIGGLGLAGAAVMAFLVPETLRQRHPPPAPEPAANTDGPRAP
jgi:MFS family permease